MKLHGGEMSFKRYSADDDISPLWRNPKKALYRYGEKLRGIPKEVVVMTTNNGGLVLDIVDGPGEMDFAIAITRRLLGRITLNHPDGRKTCQFRIGVVEIPLDPDLPLVLSGELELSLGKWVSFRDATYSLRTRKGKFIFPTPPLSPEGVCGHPVPRGERYCPTCGRDQTETAE